MDTKRVVNASGITELITGKTLENHLLPCYKQSKQLGHGLLYLKPRYLCKFRVIS